MGENILSKLKDMINMVEDMINMVEDMFNKWGTPPSTWWRISVNPE